MSTDTDTGADADPGERQLRSRTRSELLVERFRGPRSGTVLLVGTIVLAVGLALGTLAVSIDTTPPAPYVTPGELWVFQLVAVVTLVVGVLLVRAAFKVAGW